MNVLFRRVAFLLGVIVCLCPRASQARIYRVIELDPLTGDYCIPEGINNKGDIVGDLSINNGAITHPFVWQSGVTTDLGTFGGDNGAAWDINDAGSIVGDAADNNGVDHAFLTTVAGGLIPLDQMSYAGSINNQGDIAGTSLDGHSPVIVTGGSVNILSIAGAGYAINDSGWMVGQMFVSQPTPPYSVGHGFLYQNGQVTDLGILYPGNDAGAHDINDSGLIVGFGKVLGYQHACEWRNGIIKDLYRTGGPANSYCYKVNNRGDIVGGSYPNGGARYYPFYYLKGGAGEVTLRDTGWQLLEFNGINDSGQIIGGGIYGGLMHGIMLDPVKIRLKLVDVRGLPVAKDSVQVYKVEKSRPEFPATPMGTFVSDQQGLITLPADSIDVGTMFKVELTLAKTDFNKHLAVLQTMDRHFLDNARFDSLGYMTYDTISGDSIQQVKLDHSTMAYNLVVSIQWDADANYLNLTQVGFRNFSNFLYDVTDGQIRLDTIDIFTNGVLWNEADMRIFASNSVWPNANVFGINQPNQFLNLPPRWFGNADATRNGTYSETPLNLADGFDYTTRCHEFGHYALGFYDEYLFVGSSVRCGDPQAANYGYMDHQYPTSPAPYNSELSSANRYATPACRNNAQYTNRGISCWDFLKSWAEYYDTDRGVQVPITRPSDRTLASGLDYIPGPNDVQSYLGLDYDVGALVQFPVQHSAPLASTLPITLSDPATGNGIAKAGVMIKRNNGAVIIDEGQTDDFGRLKVLGYLSTDTLLCTGRITVNPGAALAMGSSEVWLTGVAAPGTATSLSMNLAPVAGDFPIICTARLDSTQLSYSLVTSRSFSALPSIDLIPSSGSSQSSSLAPATGGYGATLIASLGTDGVFLLHAVDDSAHPFFFKTPYTVTSVDTSFPSIRVLGPNGACEVTLDKQNLGLKKALVIASSYPVIRTGLDPTALQGGDAISLAVEPAISLSGTSHLTLSYSEANLYSSTGDPLEQYLRLYRWDDGLAKWTLVGGDVDTANNEVGADISTTGIYAAFTTNVPTGINDRGHSPLLPHEFELGQNFPNPFNPATTISYALPERVHVDLAIFNLLGQRVRTLRDETAAAGKYSVVWDGRDQTGRPVASGVYFYRLSSDKFVASRKMLLLK